MPRFNVNFVIIGLAETWFTEANKDIYKTWMDTIMYL